ncbi:hypothetical protein LCGC14_2918240 [marine sediment metagenome]|uniref:Ribbon-helix-helix protein CopG domain-containing protein n=1 Tax=marine sediment metagenome TaxID=412755 RepID=A0A0F8XPW5_9ZZZZ
MARTKNIYLTNAAEADLRTLATRWGLSASATIARALAQADEKGD